MLHTIYAANGIVSNAFTGPGANEIIPNEYLARLLEKRNEEVMLEYLFCHCICCPSSILPLLITQTVLSYGMDARLALFFRPSNLLSFDLPLFSYIMDVSLVSTEKNTCRIKDTAER